MEFEIVAASKNDAKFCAGLMANTAPWKTFKYSAEECVPKVEGGKWLMLAKRGADIVGFISYKPEGVGGMSAISLLCVAPEYKRQGVGKALLEYAEKHIFSYDHNVMLFVTSFNIEAINFYEKLGYKKVGEVDNYNFNGHSEFLYRKTIGPRRESV